MKIAIVGSRNFKRLDKVVRFVSHLEKDVIVVSGGARGVDQAAERAARQHGLQTLIIRPDWDKYGKSAGFRRNHTIVEQADELVAFWDGKSKGAKHSIDLARKKGIPVLVINERQS